MSLSRKNSRKIVVDREQYFWSPSQDSGYIILVVQCASGKGKKLEVIISDDHNIVIENGSYSTEIGNSNRLIITPKVVQKTIRDAITIGWQPRALGAPLELNLVDGQLIIRRGL